MTDKTRGRRPMWIAAALAFVAVGGLIAFGAARPRRVPVERAELRGVVQTVVATGRVVPAALIAIGSTRIGTVIGAFAKEGEPISKGQLLIHLDDSEPLADVARAEAAVAEARLRFANLRRLKTPQAAAELKQTELAVAQAEDDFNRFQVLFAGGAANPSQVESAKNALESARQRREQALLEASSVSAGGSTAQIALAGLAQAEAARDQARARLAQSHISSPEDGVVLKRSAEPGDVVQPGKTLLSIAAKGAEQIVVGIDERNLSGLDVGDRATVEADAFLGEPFAAKVWSIAPMVEADRGTVDVKLAVPSPPSFLRADMTVSVEIEVASKERALVVSSEALRGLKDGRSYVFVAEHGKVARRDVSLGIRGDKAVEVRLGLKEGELVLLPGAGEPEVGERIEPSTEER